MKLVVKNSMTIIIASDNPAELKEILLEFEPTSVSDKAALIEALRENRDNIVLVLDDIFCGEDSTALLSEIKNDEKLCGIPVMVSVHNEDNDGAMKKLETGADEIISKPYIERVVRNRIKSVVAERTAEELERKIETYRELLRNSELDEKTGTYNKRAFCRHARKLIEKNPDKNYIILRWDIDRFKVFNDTYGIANGDLYLSKVGEAYNSFDCAERVFGHWTADHFVACVADDDFDETKTMLGIQKLGETALKAVNADFDFGFRLGIYKIDDPSVDVEIMCDRALLALRSVKGSYNERFAYYNDSMRDSLIEEQEIVSEMKSALDAGDFVVYYQPQYNYSTKKIRGAEALVRWKHPEKGMIPPGKFIPVFEKNGFISALDSYVWEQACRFERSIIDEGIGAIPISVNVSRIDIYNPSLCEELLKLTEKYGITPSLLRLEITESAYMDNPEQLVSAVEKLRKAGFEVEMDDFGSGYSSLNTLKEVPVDVLKLDMKFLDAANDSNPRSGSILSSIIRMVHWIKVPVIAEGVEEKEQADYLKSIGCIYMQGYYFAKPMCESDFRELLKEDISESENARVFSDDIKGAERFLDPADQTALLFNSFVGGAAIVEYDGERAEAIRINDRFLEILRVTSEEFAKYRRNLLAPLSPKYARALKCAVEEAAETGKETSCEFGIKDDASEDNIWILAHVRLLATNCECKLYYIAIDDISDRTNLYIRNLQLKSQLDDIMANIPGGIFVFRIDKDGSVQTRYHSGRVATLFGYTEEEFKEKFTEDSFSGVHFDDHDAIKETIKKLWDGDDKFSMYYRRLCKDGSWLWIKLIGHVMQRSDSVIFVSAILLDEDVSVKAQEKVRVQASQLERQEFYIKNLYDAIPCGILQFVNDGGRQVLVSVNESAWKLYGYADEQKFLRAMNMRGFNSLTYPVDLPVTKKYFDIIDKTEPYEKVDFEYRYLKRDGTVGWFHCLLQKVEYGENDVVIQSYISDITERKGKSAERMSETLYEIYDDVFEVDFTEGTSSLVYFRRGGHETGKSYSVNDRLEWFCNNRVHEEDRERFCEFYDGVRNGEIKAPCSIEYRCSSACGKPQVVLTTLFKKIGSVYFNCTKIVSEENEEQ